MFTENSASRIEIDRKHTLFDRRHKYQLPLISEEYVEDMENLVLSVNNIMKL